MEEKEGQVRKFQAQHIRNAGNLGSAKGAFGDERDTKRVDDESQDKKKYRLISVDI